MMSVKSKDIFYLAIIGFLLIGGWYLISGKNNQQAGALLEKSTGSSSEPEPTSAEATNTSGLKTFVFDNFHGSTDISDKFEFQYPANWYNEGQYFSPQKIQHYTKYEVKASIWFDLVLAEIFDFTELKYQIGKSQRAKPDSTGKIDGRDFKRYDLIDYGTYGGESAGRVIIFVGPRITIDGDEYYLVFHWEEKPLAEPMPGNDAKILGEILLTLKFFPS